MITIPQRTLDYIMNFAMNHSFDKTVVLLQQMKIKYRIEVFDGYMELESAYPDTKFKYKELLVGDYPITSVMVEC